MSEVSQKSTKRFTVEQANNMLPLVRAIASDLVALSNEVIDRRHRLDDLLDGRDRDSGDVYTDELAEVEKDLERDIHKLQDFVDELRELGVEPKGPEGLVDFPAELDGRQVYLCWKLGESEVLHWHEIDAGFEERQLLTAESSTAGDFLSSEALD
ncbi:MAG: DUF2203 domain-containing protein [Pirellulaceae bacterium]|nr:DUF2203 domain-containing protein [Pirellulaceae bacterium]